MTDEVRASLAMPSEAALPVRRARPLLWVAPTGPSGDHSLAGSLGHLCVPVRGFAGTRSNEHGARREGRK